MYPESSFRPHRWNFPLCYFANINQVSGQLTVGSLSREEGAGSGECQLPARALWAALAGLVATGAFQPLVLLCPLFHSSCLGSAVTSLMLSLSQKP